VTTYDTPPTAAGEGPFGIVRGPLHSQWFTYGDAVARIDDSGTLTRYPLPTAGAITRWMTSDNHGRVWFTEFGKIGWITVDGDGNTLLREYALPYEDAGIISLVLAPNHRAYFSEQALGKIGSIDIRTGAYREYDLPSSDPLGLTLGPDGALWYTDRANAKVGRITLDGRVREWSLPPTANNGSSPVPIAHCGSPTSVATRCGGSPRAAPSPPTRSPEGRSGSASAATDSST